jgi:hypothetical protein
MRLHTVIVKEREKFYCERCGALYAEEPYDDTINYSRINDPEFFGEVDYIEVKDL